MSWERQGCLDLCPSSHNCNTPEHHTHYSDTNKKTKLLEKRSGGGSGGNYANGHNTRYFSYCLPKSLHELQCVIVYIKVAIAACTIQRNTPYTACHAFLLLAEIIFEIFLRVISNDDDISLVLSHRTRFERSAMREIDHATVKSFPPLPCRFFIDNTEHNLT